MEMDYVTRFLYQGRGKNLEEARKDLPSACLTFCSLGTVMVGAKAEHIISPADIYEA